MTKENSQERQEQGETFQEVLERRLSRRSLLKGALAAAPLLVLSPPALLSGNGRHGSSDGLKFTPISLDNRDQVVVADGYDVDVLVRWGDPLFRNSPIFDPFHQTEQAQKLQFGYNCDYVSFLPLPHHRKSRPNNALLFVNHEYTNEPIMFPGYDAQNPTEVQVDVAIAAHGCSILEIEESRSKGWRVVERSSFNRRITGETEIKITGPAAGDALMKVSYDQTGTLVRGMLNNCGGGSTPWGTVLTCEENFNQYFANRAGLPDSDPRKAVHARYGIGS
jgi:hypothetical protein